MSYFIEQYIEALKNKDEAMAELLLKQIMYLSIPFNSLGDN